MERWADENEPGWIDPTERATQYPAGGPPTVPAGEPTQAMPTGGGPPGGPGGPGGPTGPGGPGDEDDEAARRKRLIWIAVGLGAAAVIIAVLLVLLLTGGGGSSTATTTTSSSSSTSTTTTTLPPTTKPTTPPTTAAPVVTINSFNVPSTVTCSSPTTIAISWATNNATEVILSIDGASYKTYSGPAGADSVPFACNGNPHTYTITAKSASSSASRSSTVTEIPSPPTT